MDFDNSYTDLINLINISGFQRKQQICTMTMDLAAQQEMINNLTKLLEANTVQLQYTAQNNNAFFLIVMAVIIYCKQRTFSYREKNATLKIP